MTPPAIVSETFFSVGVSDMERATAFYVQALGARVAFATPRWSSLFIAGVRIGLFKDPAQNPAPAPVRTGLHFVVADLAATRASIERAGGLASTPEVEVAPGVVIADVTDTEGNTFTLRRE